MARMKAEFLCQYLPFERNKCNQLNLRSSVLFLRQGAKKYLFGPCLRKSTSDCRLHYTLISFSLLFVEDAKKPRERRKLINECNRVDTTDLIRALMTAVSLK